MAAASSFRGTYSGSGSDGDGVLSSRSVRFACLAAGAATAGAAVCWLLYARSRPRPEKEDILLALARMKVECADVYAEVAAAIAKAGPLPPTVAASIHAAAWKSKGEAVEGPAPERDDPALKLRQIVEQPLVLSGALGIAAQNAAQLLPGCDNTAEALEDELCRFEAEPEVQAATAELRDMHEACLLCRDNAALLATPASQEVWVAEALLEMLRELGCAKNDALLVGLKGPPSRGSGVSDRGLGARVMQACAASEDLVWEQKWPGDWARRCSFIAALASFSAKDRIFRDRQAAIERELESTMVPVAATAAHRIMAAF